MFDLTNSCNFDERNNPVNRSVTTAVLVSLQISRQSASDVEHRTADAETHCAETGRKAFAQACASATV